jgi:hypothetical protein
MSELVYIPLSEAELARRISLVANGYSLDQASELLGGLPYERKMEEEKLRAFWRFRILEREGLSDPYEIYLGEFVNDRLGFGFILPHA